MNISPTTLNAGAAVNGGLARDYTETSNTSNGQLACTVLYTSRVDTQDFIALVCQKGPRWGEIGQVINYFGKQVEIAFEDGLNETFNGPLLNRLRSPLLNEGYGVQPFYVGDIAITKGIRSSSDDPRKILESMGAIGRNHLGLMKLCTELGRHPVEYCASRVQKILQVRAVKSRNIKNE